MGLKTRFHKIDLRQIPEMGSIKFLYAETSATATGSLVIVHYADHGQEEPDGLRLDLDKEVFLDHVDDPRKDSVFSLNASVVASTVFSEISDLEQEPEN